MLMRNDVCRSNFGFTLIEVMITVAILGILLAVAMPAYGEYVKEGRRAEAQQYILQLRRKGRI